MTHRAAKKLAAMLAILVTASFALPAFADEHHARGHHHPRPHPVYRPGYVYAPPPVYYAPPAPPPVVPSLNIVVPLIR